MSIQTSNFVSSSVKPEIEQSLNRLYTYLCELATSTTSKQWSAVGASILDKFVESTLFDNHSSATNPSAHTPSTTPTKLTSPQTTATVSYSFFQFAFKFLIDYEADGEDDLNCGKVNSSQLETIRLFDAHLDQLLEVNKRTESWLLMSVIMALAWCFTSKSSQIRLTALALVQKLNVRLDDDEFATWKLFLKKFVF